MHHYQPNVRYVDQSILVGVKSTNLSEQLILCAHVQSGLLSDLLTFQTPILSSLRMTPSTHRSASAPAFGV